MNTSGSILNRPKFINYVTNSFSIYIQLRMFKYHISPIRRLTFIIFGNIWGIHLPQYRLHRWGMSLLEIRCQFLLPPPLRICFFHSNMVASATRSPAMLRSASHMLFTCSPSRSQALAFPRSTSWSFFYMLLLIRACDMNKWKDLHLFFLIDASLLRSSLDYTMWNWLISFLMKNPLLSLRLKFILIVFLCFVSGKLSVFIFGLSCSKNG